MGLPVGDEDLVGPFGLLGDPLFLVASLLVVVGRARGAVVAATRWRPGRQLQLPPLVGDQAGPGECVVLVLGDQVPGQHRHLPGGRDDRGLESAARLDALVERPQRAGRPARGPGRLDQDSADLGPAGFADPAVDRGGVAGLADLRVQPDIGDQPIRVGEPGEVADRSHDRDPCDRVDTGVSTAAKAPPRPVHNSRLMFLVISQKVDHLQACAFTSIYMNPSFVYTQSNFIHLKCV